MVLLSTANALGINALSAGTTSFIRFTERSEKLLFPKLNSFSLTRDLEFMSIEIALDSIDIKISKPKLKDKEIFYMLLLPALYILWN